MAVKVAVYKYGQEILDALGITDPRVTRVLIDLDINSDDGLVKVYTTRFLIPEKPLADALKQCNGIEVQEADNAFIQELIDNAQRGRK